MREILIVWHTKTLLGILAITALFGVGLIISQPIRRYVLEEIRARRIHRAIRLYGTLAGHPILILRSLTY